MIMALIFALCMGIVWSLWLLARHIKKRVEVEAERDRLYNLSLDLVCIIGIDGKLKRVNPAFQRILGFSGDALLATPFLDFVHPDDRAASELAVERLTREKQTVYFENRCRTADRQYKWLSWSANPAKEQGLIFAVANDITVRKQAELALKESHERFVTVLDGLDVSIYVVDLTPANCSSPTSISTRASRSRHRDADGKIRAEFDPCRTSTSQSTFAR
jgi:PAS domain S-box-containing protein